MKDIRTIIEENITTHQQILADHSIIEKIQQAADIIADAFRKEGKVYFCGNGGSAADAQHLAAEFSGRFYLERPALPAEALHCNTSYLTAVGNDYGYERVYSRMIDGVGKEGDVVVGLSTSGNSENIINAYQSAKVKKMTIISFTGDTGGKMREYSDILLNVPSKITPRIQEAHIMMGHIVCELVEDMLFGK